jgi:WD40 repeat protein
MRWVYPKRAFTEFSANLSLQVPRTSGLDAPIMELTGEMLSPICCSPRANRRYLLGHSGEVFAVRFDPTAQHIASGSMDRSICMSPLWEYDRRIHY